MKKISSLLFTLVFCASSCLVYGQSSTPCNNNGAACRSGINKYFPGTTQQNRIPPPGPLDGSSTLGATGATYSNSACGLNYVQASSVVQRRSANQSPPFNINGTGNPSSVTIAGLPSCYIIEKAYVWIAASYYTPQPPTPGLTITNPATVSNSYAFTRIGTDGDKCWGETGTVAYRADVTSNITGNGTYNLNITGYPTASNDVDGVTLLIIYRDPAAAYQGSLIIWDGITTAGNFNATGFPFLLPPANRGVNITGFNACAASTAARAFLIVSDMQQGTNGSAHNTTLNGAVASYPNNFWNFDVANTTVTAGQNSSTFRANGAGNDCFSVIVEGLYFQTTSCVVCTPVTPLVVNATTNPAVCGACNGSATANPAGGTTPYKYTWASGSTTQTISGLCAGSYGVNVTDNSGCYTANYVATVGQAGSLTANIASSTNTSCSGSCNGTATAGQTGGNTPFTYLWSASAQTTLTATGLCVGTYTVNVTDVNNCSSTATVTISNPVAFSSSASNTNVSCNGGADGTATVTPAGGTGAYTYLWSNGTSFQTATSLSAGSYTAIVSDVNGCTTVSTAVVTEPVALTTTSSVTNTSCNGGNNGTATASPAGGTGNYNYLWSSGANTQTASSLSAGTYGVTVTDANSCPTSTSVTISEPSALVLNTSSTPSQCNPPSGTAAVTASGGTGAYNYLWITGATTQTASALAAGSYSVIVSDNNGCTQTASATVGQVPGFTASVPVSTNALCNAACNGSASASATGGVSPFVYLWSDGQNSAVATGLCAGTYGVLITDNNNCSSAALVTITEPAVLSATIPPVNTICISQNAVITVNTSGGTANYGYIWDTGQQGNPVSVNPTTTTTYSVLVTDVNNCTTTAATAITVNPALTAGSNVGASVCSGQSVNIDATGSGGNGGPYNYAWSPTSNVACPACQNTSANPASTTTYTVSVTDNCGTPASVSSVVVTINPLPVVSVSLPPTICNGGSTQLTSGTTTTSTSVWNPATGLDDPNSPAPLASPSVTTTYNVLVTDNNGCTGTGSVLVTVSAPPVADAGTAPEICLGESAQLFASGGSNYVWTPSSGLSQTNIPGPIAAPSSTTTYVVTASTNPNCPSDSDSVTVIVHLPPAINAGSDTTIMAGDTVLLSSTSTGVLYQWYPATGLSCMNCLSPSANPLKTTTYIIVATDSFGCKNQDTVVVNVEDFISLFLPNAFTPFNNDFTNNLFYSYGVGISEFEFSVFNRWGELIFQTRDPRLGWDGSYKGQMVQSDVYGYIAKAISFTGKTITKTGSITVVK